jgi:FeS assembly SUF system regulator
LVLIALNRKGRPAVIKLSRMADYGVVVMTQLARAPGVVHTAPGVAAVTSLPAPTVSKVLKLLANASLLESRRGTNGGYSLTRPAADITMADIIGAVDGPIALTECVGSDGAICEIEALCPTRTNWRRINDALVGALQGVTLAEMAAPIDFLGLLDARRFASRARAPAREAAG